MKIVKLPIISIILLSNLLIGCCHSSIENDQNRRLSQVPKRKFFILDSVNTPLPPEAKAIQSIESSGKLRQIPIAKFSDPIVITKMPLKKIR